MLICWLWAFINVRIDSAKNMVFLRIYSANQRYPQPEDRIEFVDMEELNGRIAAFMRCPGQPAGNPAILIPGL
jgi:hypothetical protein